MVKQGIHNCKSKVVGIFLSVMLYTTLWGAVTQPLHEAARTGDLKEVQKLLAETQNASSQNSSNPSEQNSTAMLVDATDQDGNTPLHLASKGGHADIVAELCRNGANVNATGYNSFTAANLAAHYGHVDVVIELFKYNPNLYITTTGGWMPVHTAAAQGHTEMVTILGKRIADINAATRDKWTPLHLAANNGHTELVAELCKKGANVSSVDYYYNTPLHLAAKNGHTEVVAKLCEHSANVNAVGPSRRTPLWEAAAKGHTDIVTLLAKLGAKVNASDNFGCTPLYVAAYKEKLSLVRTLAALGADINAARDNTRTPLYEAAERGRLEVVKCLVEAGADVNAARDNGCTPLYIASANGHLDVVDYLVQHDANVNTPSAYGWTPAYAATWSSKHNIVKFLVEQGVDDFGVRDAKTYVRLLRYPALHDLPTPLHLATSSGAINFVAGLCKSKTNVNARNLSLRTPLHLAAMNGRADIVTELCKHDAAVNQRDRNGAAPLHFAACFGQHVGAVGELCKHGAKINSADKGGSTPLHVAAIRGHANTVAKLCKLGADVNVKNRKGMTPLYAGVKYNQLGVVRKLCEHGAKVNAAEDGRYTPLHIAADRGHEELVDELCKQGAKVNAVDANGITPLHLASRNGHEGVVTVLAKHNANVDSSNEDDQTALHFAVCRGQLGTTTNLCIHGANVNFPNKLSQTPLHQAAYLGHACIVDELCKHGATVNILDQDGLTPLHIAAEYGHVSVAAALCKLGAEVNTRNKKESAPLHIASAKGYTDMVRELCKHNADVNITEKCGKTPLHFAADGGHVSIVANLCEHSANVTHTDKYGYTALHIAARKGHVNVVAELCKQGAEVNSCNKWGRTPLHLASVEGNVEIVIELCKAGANVNAPTRDGHTPLYLAALAGHSNVVAELYKNNADVNFPDQEGHTQLFIAAHNCDLDVVITLCKLGANVNASSLDGSTPLLSAAYRGHGEIVAELCRHKADVNAANKDAPCPLQVAFDRKNYDCACILLAQPTINPNITVSEDAPLPLAALEQHREAVVKALIKCKNTDWKTYIPQLYKDKNYNDLMFLISRVLQVASRGSNEVLERVSNHDDFEDLLKQKDKQGKRLLHYAAEYGHIAAADIFLEAGAAVNAKADDGSTPLHCAVAAGHHAMVRLLCKHGASLKAANKNGDRALHVAAQHNQADIVAELVQADEQRYTLHMINADGLTPLHCAALQGSTKAADVLVHHVADAQKSSLLEQRTPEELTPLDLAIAHDRQDTALRLYTLGASCEHLQEAEQNKLRTIIAQGLRKALETNDEEIVRDILNTDEQLHSVPFQDGMYPLHVATQQGSIQCVQELLFKGASASQETDNEKRMTALAIAAKEGNLEAFEVLHSRGDVHSDGCPAGGVSRNVDSLFHHAARSGNRNMVQYLLEHKLDDPRAVNDKREEPIHCAARKGHDDILSLLIEHDKGSVHATDHAGNSSLHYAAELPDPACCKLLIKNGAYPDKKNRNADLPAHRAAARGHCATLETLMPTDIVQQLDAQNKQGQTPLHAACQHGQLDAALFLCQKGADVALQDRVGDTALHVAVQHDKSTTMLEGMLEAVQAAGQSANVNVFNNQGKTPYVIAHERGLARDKELLARHQAIPLEAASMTDLLFDAVTKSDATRVKYLLGDQSALPDFDVAAPYPEEGVQADVFENDSLLECALNIAAEAIEQQRKTRPDCISIIQTLLKKCASNEGSFPLIAHESSTVLHWAAAYGVTSVLEYVLQAEHPVDATDARGRTPLYLATERGNYTAVSVLLEHGADPLFQSLPSPYQCALDLENREVLDTYFLHFLTNHKIEAYKQPLQLLAQRCSFNVVNSQGETALHVLCRSMCNGDLTDEECELLTQLFSTCILGQSPEDLPLEKRDADGTLAYYWLDERMHEDRKQEMQQRIGEQDIVHAVQPLQVYTPYNDWPLMKLTLFLPKAAEQRIMGVVQLLRDGGGLKAPPCLFLFEGPAGSGKQTFARALTRESGREFLDVYSICDELLTPREKRECNGDISRILEETYFWNGVIKVDFKRILVLLYEKACNAAAQGRGAVVYVGRIDTQCKAPEKGSNRDKACFELQSLLHKLNTSRDQREPHRKITIMATTRDANQLDAEFMSHVNPAFVIKLPLPDERARTKVLDTALLKYPRIELAPTDVARVSRATQGFTPRQLTRLVESSEHMACIDRSPGTNISITLDDICAACEHTFPYVFAENEWKRSLELILEEESFLSFDDIVSATREVARYKRLAESYSLRAHNPGGIKLDPDNDVLMIIMHGPPGTGKTALAQAFAHAAGLPFVKKVASDFNKSPGAGSSAPAIRSFFEQFEQGGPYVVFLDEVDAIAGFNTKDLDTSGINGCIEQERINIFTQFFTSLEEFCEKKRGIFIAATNRYDSLDSRLQDRNEWPLHVPVPDEAERKEILRRMLVQRSTHNKQAIRITPEVLEEEHLQYVAEQTYGFSGRKLKHLIKRALAYAKDESGSEGITLTPSHFSLALPHMITEVEEENSTRENEDEQIRRRMDELHHRERAHRQEQRDYAYQQDQARKRERCDAQRFAQQQESFERSRRRAQQEQKQMHDEFTRKIEREQDAIRREKRDLRREQERTQKQYKQEMKEARQDFENKIEKMQKQQRAELERARNQLSDQAHAQKKEFKADVEKLQEKQKTELKALRKEYEDRLEKIEKKYEENIRAMQKANRS